jgi:hypothetical protein
MKTDDLINALVADNATVAPPVSRTFAWSVVAGTAIAALLFAATLGARSDFAYSIFTPRFGYKFIVTLALAIPAFFIVKRLAHPDQSAGGLAWLLGLPIGLLAVAVAVEMSLVPAEHWHVYQVGSNAIACTLLIPLLSLAPLAAVLYALRQGAPANPTLAGALGGLLSAGIGATLYASHCVDDSPLFVSTWYPLATAIVVAAGALLGRKLLRW